jgi:tetratricopeptide (TPR) repeat protein
LIAPYFMERKLPVSRLEAVIHHYGKVDAEREDTKKTYYLRLAEEECAAHPGDSQCLFNLMSQARVAGEWEKALAAAEAYMKLVKDVPLTVLLTAAMAHQQEGRHEEALIPLQTILKAHPEHALALSRLPLSLAILGRIEESRVALEKAIAAEPGFTSSYITLAEIEGQLGHFDEARGALRRGIAANPEEERLWQSLVLLDIQHQQEALAVADAWEAVQTLPSGGSGQWHALVAGYLLKVGRTDQARSVLGLGLQAFPGHESLKRLAAMAAGA